MKEVFSLCHVGVFAYGLFWGASVTFIALVAYGFGWNVATRRHWKMLRRAGSYTSRG